MSPRNLFRIALALAALGWFGWTWYRGQHPQAEDAGPRPRAAASHATPAAPPAPRKYGRIAFTPCTLAASMPGRPSVEAQCGSLRVAENPAQPQGRGIDLRIAWIPADDDARLEPDPLFAISGGPGESIVDGWPGMAAAFGEVLKTRNIVLVDQRGTGRSNPLRCDFGDLNDTSVQALVPATQACRDALQQRADLRFYGTSQAVADLDAVRQALGVDKLNLYGVSYGTRVAQQYAMRHPQRVRSIILDSVVPNTLTIGNIFARNLDHALALQFGRCSADPACKAKLGDPRAELDTLLATLRKAPPTVEYRDAATGETRSKVLTAGDVAGLVRMYAYMPTASSLLPLLVHEANQGRYGNLAALGSMDMLQDAIAMGMQLSVICSEDGDSLVARDEDTDTVLGNALAEAMAAQCKVWPKGAVPADFRAPLRGSVPVLVLEGEYDPVTPPDYGRQVLQTLPNGRLLVLRGQGHAVFSAGCTPKLMTQFIDTADARTLDAGCLQRLPYTPPFTSFNGWSP
ncbi:alpha/beta hydrolase [Luteimonas aquatica]|uniref:alpha/beta hydrolase n=1 Tax=Luteimonas aquatica TaxID=450364 RepID=UPI001F572AFB|nr:alpha/beta hydrolase [Luteimonas aquatica]